VSRRLAPVTEGGGNFDTVYHRLSANPGPLIEFMAERIVALGALSEWSMDDNRAVAEGLARLAEVEYRLPPVGNQTDEALQFYGEAARHLGLDHDLP
jgi:hypothetical protein